MMNPNILPPDAWKHENNQFLAADGQLFSTHLVSKHKIGLQFFPSFTICTYIIGTPLPDKDILIGWDIYSQARSIRILPQGIHFKKEFLSQTCSHDRNPLTSSLMQGQSP
ncbi:hypothetical protein Ddye_003852 [Dipteronia dyeriana]|uniref:Uncharacterized protein n=1 Tax=Dipteronia dyeriana TaxID=168575 RepID=A0AAE0CWD9_9ROSI|nr:hypothetical protein Ddye_003852 [Dipteronia dyeriana]